MKNFLRLFLNISKERDHGWISVLLEEVIFYFTSVELIFFKAENERMHLLTWMQVIQPTFLERVVVILAQLFYTPFYTLMYVFSPKTAHRYFFKL